MMSETNEEPDMSIESGALASVHLLPRLVCHCGEHLTNWGTCAHGISDAPCMDCEECEREGDTLAAEVQP